MLGVDLLIFVILGTQDKKFPRLLNAVQKQIELGNIKEEVVVQAGSTVFASEEMQIFDYIEVEQFEQLVKAANIIICHAGVGTILTALKEGKKIIAAARLKKYGEHVNDHQLQILSNFTQAGYILALEDFEKLDSLLKQAKKFEPAMFQSNNRFFIKELQNEIENLTKR